MSFFTVLAWIDRLKNEINMPINSFIFLPIDFSIPVAADEFKIVGEGVAQVKIMGKMR
jgi:hypothetical protein